MPLDITLFRAGSGGNPDLIRESQRRRFSPVEWVDEVIAKDDRWRLLTGTIDQLKKQRNLVQKDVATKKKAGEPCDEMVAQIKTIGEDIVGVETEQKNLKIEIDKMIGKIGNHLNTVVMIL